MKFKNYKKNNQINVGIYGISGQSGKAYLADLLQMPVRVYGYARASENGLETVEAIHRQGGIELQRPANRNEPTSRMISLGQSAVGHDLERLIEESDIILFTHPSVYHEETAALMKEGLSRRKVPLILSPSRTLATPYLWQILGEEYPIMALQTCPYSCKSYTPGSSYIKRRKKNWIASVEGNVPLWILHEFKKLYPQTVYSDVPATTSLGNIGAVFHPTGYVLNQEGIRAAEARGEKFSFYVEGIANNPVVGQVVEEVDQIRLRIAKALGCEVYGLKENPQEEEFVTVMKQVAELEKQGHVNDPDICRQRSEQLEKVKDAVVSSQLWLASTYGVERIPGESLASAIGRTPHFQERSYPQQRYADEDIPTGLVPLESLAQRLGIDHAPITHVIDTYNQMTGKDLRQSGRNLAPFSTEYLQRYLLGQLQGYHKQPCKKVA